MKSTFYKYNEADRHLALICNINNANLFVSFITKNSQFEKINQFKKVLVIVFSSNNIIFQSGHFITDRSNYDKDDSEEVNTKKKKKLDHLISLYYSILI
jgi:hypothetical protein